MERYDENTKYPKFDFSVWKKISFIDARELVGERLLKNPQTAGRAKKLLGDDFARLAELAADAVRISENPDFENGWRAGGHSSFRQAPKRSRCRTNARIRDGNPSRCRRKISSESRTPFGRRAERSTRRRRGFTATWESAKSATRGCRSPTKTEGDFGKAHSGSVGFFRLREA